MKKGSTGNTYYRDPATDPTTIYMSEAAAEKTRMLHLKLFTLKEMEQICISNYQTRKKLKEEKLAKIIAKKKVERALLGLS
jgi:hypothetical protein